MLTQGLHGWIVQDKCSGCAFHAARTINPVGSCPEVRPVSFVISDLENEDATDDSEDSNFNRAVRIRINVPP